MVTRYTLTLYAPLTRAYIFDIYNGEYFYLYSGEQNTKVITTQGNLRIVNVTSASYPSMPEVDVLITDRITSSSWRLSADHLIEQQSKAERHIKFEYSHYVSPYTTFIIRADFNCGGVRFRTTSGEYYSVDTHGGQVTVSTSDNLIIYDVRDLNGNSVGLSKCYAYDILYTQTRWNLGEDPVINAVSGGGVTREVIIKVATNIPLFHWEDDDDLIAAGQVISMHITAARWNSFIDTVYEICQICGITWTKSNVSSGDTITAAIFNHAGLALNNLPDTTRRVPWVEAGDILRASYFVGTSSLKDVLNQEIQSLNGN